MWVPSCWKPRCRKGGCPFWRCSSGQCVTLRIRLGVRVQKSLWWLMVELEVREWWMIGEERKRSILGSKVKLKQDQWFLYLFASFTHWLHLAWWFCWLLFFLLPLPYSGMTPPVLHLPSWRMVQVGPLRNQCMWRSGHRRPLSGHRWLEERN